MKNVIYYAVFFCGLHMKDTEKEKNQWSSTIRTSIIHINYLSSKFICTQFHCSSIA